MNATPHEKQTIDTYTRQIEELRNELIEKSEQLGDLKLQIYARIHGVEEGTIIQAGDMEYKVTKIYVWDKYAERKVGLNGVKRLRNGKWGKREMHIWSNWEVKGEENDG